MDSAIRSPNNRSWERGCRVEIKPPIPKLKGELLRHYTIEKSPCIQHDQPITCEFLSTSLFRKGKMRNAVPKTIHMNCSSRLVFLLRIRCETCRIHFYTFTWTQIKGLSPNLHERKQGCKMYRNMGAVDLTKDFKLTFVGCSTSTACYRSGEWS